MKNYLLIALFGLGLLAPVMCSGQSSDSLFNKIELIRKSEIGYASAKKRAIWLNDLVLVKTKTWRTIGRLTKITKDSLELINEKGEGKSTRVAIIDISIIQEYRGAFNNVIGWSTIIGGWIDAIGGTALAVIESVDAVEAVVYTVVASSSGVAAIYFGQQYRGKRYNLEKKWAIYQSGS